MAPPTGLEVGYQMGIIWSNALVFEELLRLWFENKNENDSVMKGAKAGGGERGWGLWK